MKQIVSVILCWCLIFMICSSSAEGYTPGKETCGRENCFWETPMDITDEERIWAMLTQTMTVVQGDSRSQSPVYKEPDKNAEVIGEVTCETQGLHVIENLDNGWTKIECYSSSFKGSKVEAYWLLVAFTYGELEDEPFAQLNAYQYCYPALRVEEIDAINAVHTEN